MVERDPDLIHYFKSYKKEIAKGQLEKIFMPDDEQNFPLYV